MAHEVKFDGWRGQLHYVSHAARIYGRGGSDLTLRFRTVGAALLALRAAELRIMSCGPAGLARDLAALRPAYELVELRAFDTLPQTPHVELVASLLAIAPLP